VSNRLPNGFRGARPAADVPEGRAVRAWPRAGLVGYHRKMPDDTSRRRSLLTTALVGALLPADVTEGRMMRAWLDNWRGIGHVATGMARQGYVARGGRACGSGPPSDHGIRTPGEADPDPLPHSRGGRVPLGARDP
jgi:hypothetical protein